MTFPALSFGTKLSGSEKVLFPTCVGRRARSLFLLNVPQSPQNLSHCNIGTAAHVTLSFHNSATLLSAASSQVCKAQGLPLHLAGAFQHRVHYKLTASKVGSRRDLLFPSVQGRTSLPVVPLRAATESRHSRPSSFVASDFGDGIARRVHRRQRCRSGSEVTADVKLTAAYLHTFGAWRESV